MLCLVIRLRVSNKRVLDAVGFHKSTEFFRSEQCTVIMNEMLWNAILSKHIKKLCYCCFIGDSEHYLYFKPFGVAINNN